MENNPGSEICGMAMSSEVSHMTHENEKTDLKHVKVFVVVIPKEGCAHMAAPILLLV